MSMALELSLLKSVESILHIVSLYIFTVLFPIRFVQDNSYSSTSSHYIRHRLFLINCHFGEKG